MDLIIVDGDCQSMWSVSELERLLDAKQDAIWFFNDSTLREKKFNAYAAADVPAEQSVEKGILITKLQNGVLKYHKEMLRNTFGCKFWIIAVMDGGAVAYREQYCEALDSALNALEIRYEIIFEDSPLLSLTAEEKKEPAIGLPYCIIATSRDEQLAACVRDVLKSSLPEWRFECHVGQTEDEYKRADFVLIVGRDVEDCLVPAVRVNTGRVRIWLSLRRGEDCSERAVQVKNGMNAHGWNLGDRKLFGSCLEYETLLAEFERGEISVETLSVDERFVIWDRYGLPLPEHAYWKAEKVETFLRSQCCLAHIF